MNDYAVYTMALAKHLNRKGFEWKSVGVSKKDPTKVIFYFENTPELVNEIEKYKEGITNERNKG